MNPIDYRELPPTPDGFSRLFKDYIYNTSRLQHLFAGDFHSLDNIQQHLPRSQKSKEHRAVLCDILIEQHKQFGCSDNILAAIESLRDENTFCVVTGQQVGILGGPLYTLYKAFTAIQLANHLNQRIPSCTFVPVFWLEGEDHDFAEVNSITLLNQENQPVKIEYFLNGKSPGRNLGAVGELVLDEAWEQCLAQIEKVLPNTEFRPSLLNKVRRAYRQGKTLNSAFVGWISSIITELIDKPLIFLSSNDRRIKQILRPVFLKELQEFPRTSQLVIDQSALLEGTYHAQIKPRAINLFLFYKDGRYLIEPRENDFSLKGVRYFPTRDELLRIVEESPEMISPNVILRTICQDTLLPTVIYVAGPSEVAYFAQLKPVYEYFGVPMPMIYPRMSATIVEQKLQTVMDKYELHPVDFFGNKKKLNDRVIDILSEVNLDTLFDHARGRVDELTGELKFGLDYIDTTLTGALETTRAKIESQLHVLKEKAAAAQRRKHEVALRQIDKVLNNIFPNNNFQEREINILHFMNKYGMDFPKRLYDELRFDVHAHQVILL